jgi:ribosomal protein S21
MGMKIVVRKGESVQEAYRRLKDILDRESAHDKWRRRWWGAERYEKPSKRRRRKGWNLGPNG